MKRSVQGLTLRVDLKRFHDTEGIYGFGTGSHLLGIRAMLFDRVPIVAVGYSFFLLSNMVSFSSGDPL